MASDLVGLRSAAHPMAGSESGGVDIDDVDDVESK